MIIEKGGQADYSQCRIPGIVVTQTGALLAYYECRRSSSDWADIDIKIIRSTDEGESWSTVALIPGNGNTLNNPVMFVTADALHFLYFKNYKTLFHCTSTDDGRHFSEPKEKEIPCDAFFNAVAIGPGHGIVHEGKMIVPIWFACNREEPKAHRPSFIATLYSTDGERWHLGDAVGEAVLNNPSECALAVTAEGKVLISIRNENRYKKRALSQSDSGIGGWSEPVFHPRLTDPVCMGSMCCENGTVYHINCDSDSARENLTVKVSKDCFETFESIPIDAVAGYSDVAVREEKLYILYERNYGADGLHFKKITL